MKTSIIACVNEKRALGKNGDLLYKISNDLKNFKKLTKGHIVIMGKNTWDSLPVKPLPERLNIVLSKDGMTYDELCVLDFEETVSKNPLIIKSIGDAMDLSYDMMDNGLDDEVFIIGGASVYKRAIESGLVDNIYLTEVLDDAEGDVYFPDLEKYGYWQEWFCTDPITDPETNLKYRYRFLKKI